MPCRPAFRRSWAEANAAADSDPVRYGVGEPDGRRFWHALVHATFAKIELPKDFEAFFDELYWLFSQPTVWRLYPECLAVLQTLRQRGYTVGVISNWDIRLLDLLHGLGLMACVQHVNISAVVGWEKPHGNISRTPSTPLAWLPCAPCMLGIACTPTCTARGKPACSRCGCDGTTMRTAMVCPEMMR